MSEKFGATLRHQVVGALRHTTSQRPTHSHGNSAGAQEGACVFFGHSPGRDGAEVRKWTEEIADICGPQRAGRKDLDLPEAMFKYREHLRWRQGTGNARNTVPTRRGQSAG